jgi:predicted membrane channel-forming protein YqfA (hemolysin III family)
MLETTSYSHLWVLLLSIVVAVPAVIIATLRTRALSVVSKVLWTLVLLVPLLGVVFWAIMKPAGPLMQRRRRTEP